MEKIDFRIERTYLSLNNAFSSLMEEKNFEDITVDELCKQAMIRRATFYTHFKDKLDYFSHYLKETCSAFQKQLSSDMQEKDITSCLMYVTREMLRFMKCNSKTVKHIAQSNMFPFLFDIFSEQMRTDLLNFFRSTCEREDADSDKLEAAAAYYAGGILSVFRLCLKTGTEIEEDKFIDIIFSLMIGDNIITKNK